MSTGVVTSKTFTQRLVKTICQQYDFRMGTKRRTSLFCLSVEQSCPTDRVVAAEDHGTDMCHTFTPTQSLRFTGYIGAWELRHSVVFDQKPRISVSYILNSFIFNSLYAVAQNTGESHQFGFPLNSEAKQQVWQKHWRLHWQALILRALLGWCYHPFIIHILPHIHGMTSKQVYTCHLPGLCAAMSVFWMISLCDKLC